MMKRFIRRARPEDYPAVDRLMYKLHCLHVEGESEIYRPVEHPYSEDEYKTMLKERANVMLCAEIDGEVAGYASMTLKDVRSPQLICRRIAYVNELIMSPDARGKGTGRQMMEALEMEGKKAGAVEMQLMVWEFNVSALDFYQSLGMKTQRRILEKKL